MSMPEVLHAALHGDLDRLKTEYEEDPSCVESVKDKEGFNALLYATVNSNLEVIRYLVEEAHVDVNVQTREGRTALMIAAFNSQLPVVRYLADVAHADVTLQNDQGETVFDCAKVESFIFNVGMRDTTNWLDRNRTRLEAASRAAHLPPK